MNFIHRFLRKHRRLQIPNLMIYVTATMLAVYALQFVLRSVLPIPLTQLLEFDRTLILQGQVWRLLSFVVVPPGSSNMLWLLITLYFYYFVGSQLEDVWGESQFTFYYLLGVLGAIVAGFIAGGTSNTYLNLSLFFAFAHLFPNHQVLLFFLIPIKMKYLAWFNWFFFAVNFIFGNMVQRVTIVLSLLNFFLFFGPEIFSQIRERIRTRKRRKEFRRQMRGDNDLWR